MPLTTRLATLADAETIGAIVDAMDRHYRGPDGASGVAASAAMVRRTMAEQEGTRFLLAFENETPVGIACFGILRPGRQLSGVIFLKDLFTLPEHRSRGVGRTLLRDLAHYAVATMQCGFVCIARIAGRCLAAVRVGASVIRVHNSLRGVEFFCAK